MAIRENLQRVRNRMRDAALSVGRDPESVTLIAVSKTVSSDSIREAYEAGQRDFGESRLQEALPKIEVLPADIRWHFIGKLQSNKAKRAGQAFHVIQTLESAHQIRELAKIGRAHV